MPAASIRVACAREVLRVAPGLKVAVVLGDDVYPPPRRIPRQGLRDARHGYRRAALAPFAIASSAPTPTSARSRWPKRWPPARDVVIAGRSTDTALTLAPMVHEFGWKPDDCDKLAAGTIAGHIIECGAQCTGGNCQVDWETIPDMADIGYPDRRSRTRRDLRRHQARRRRRPRHTRHREGAAALRTGRSEELHHARLRCRFHHASSSPMTGPDRVRVTGIRGGPRPPSLKLSISYTNGWKAIGTLVYSWPQALEKARAADRIVRERLRNARPAASTKSTPSFSASMPVRAGCAAQSRSARSATPHRRARAGQEAPSTASPAN